ncbi:hypothetical protein ABZX90_36605 [Streptomyces sp. NPDC002935]
MVATCSLADVVDTVEQAYRTLAAGKMSRPARSLMDSTRRVVSR